MYMPRYYLRMYILKPPTICIIIIFFPVVFVSIDVI